MPTALERLVWGYGDGSTLTVLEFRNEKQRIYGALVEHRLRKSGDTFRIAHKRVDLVNSEGEIDGIAILL